MRLATVVAAHHVGPQVNFQGRPPELRGGTDERRPMASASYLVIEEKASGIFLDRFSADGESAGDTWHLSIEDAQEQAMYEFDGALNEWESVPDDVDDVRFWLLNRGRD